MVIGENGAAEYHHEGHGEHEGFWGIFSRGDAEAQRNLEFHHQGAKDSKSNGRGSERMGKGDRLVFGACAGNAGPVRPGEMFFRCEVGGDTCRKNVLFSRGDVRIRCSRGPAAYLS